MYISLFLDLGQIRLVLVVCLVMLIKGALGLLQLVLLLRKLVLEVCNDLIQLCHLLGVVCQVIALGLDFALQLRCLNIFLLVPDLGVLLH